MFIHDATAQQHCCARASHPHELINVVATTYGCNVYFASVMSLATVLTHMSVFAVSNVTGPSQLEQVCSPTSQAGSHCTAAYAGIQSY
jgi:hypothetical protein